ncbi:MAG TPA: trimethylamine methyltransferase family protein [Thermoplasmata archaeon]
MPRASMSVLSRSDVERIHDASLRILSEVGVRIDSPSVLRMMREAGVRMDEGKMLVFPDESLVAGALRSAPRKVRICSRGGRDYVVPEDGVQLVSTDGQPPAVLDMSTGKKRPSTLKDVIDMAVLADALPEVDFIWPPIVATDMPPEKSTYYEFVATVANSSKHVQHGAGSADEANFQIELASAIVGSGEDLRRRPIFSDVCTPISPLRYDQGEAEAMVVLAKAGVPVVQLSMGIAGAVTPVTVAGTLATINAENLCGLTISQVANPGAPSIYSSFSGVSDLKTGVFVCGTPEGVLMDIAAIEMARHYGLPSCAGGPATSARSISAEAGYQTAMTAMASVLTGSDLMVGLGGLDRDGVFSAEKLVMDCEMWRWMERLRYGIDVDDNKLGLDAVKRQGPGGTFLSDPHTLQHMRKDLMIPQVTAHRASGELDQSHDDLREFARKRTKDLLATHKPELLGKEVASKVAEIAKKWGVLHTNGSQIFRHA